MPSLVAPTKERTPSLRSVGSNSSITSGVSLTRRPRTRARSRTVTGGQPDTASLRNAAVMESGFFGKPVVAEPESVHSPRSTDPSPSRVQPQPATADAHIPDSKCSERGESGPAAALLGVSAVTGQNLSTVDLQPNPPPSAFIVPMQHANVRDSMFSQTSNFTQQSGTSSSLYPPSTSTASGTESPPSPRSIVDPDGDMDVPIMDDLQEYDGDDVSYRLRLLVKNNYFLPPAHSKPSASDFAPTPSLQKKPSAPGFFDLFRGKSKSKPSTPLDTSPPTDGMAPVLRTTSDSSTTATYAPFAQPRSSSHSHRPPHTSTTHDRSGRVVVVREKMSDLAGAAKQAEQDMKSRGGRLGSQKGQQEAFDDVIDPTDAVDLPLPSAKYPFAVQASALHGLGVQDSLDPDDDWRKALLKAAVGHSLDNLHGNSTPTPMSALKESSSPAHPIVSDGSPTGWSRPPSRQHASRARGLSSPDPVSPTSPLPMRAETPLTPLIPLSPPPRRIINPLYSLSQTDLGGPPVHSSHVVPPLPSSHLLRKATSSPGLNSMARARLTPPPLPMDTLRSSFETSREHWAGSFHSESIYSDDDGEHDRSSATLSYYTQASPTASAFHDALNRGPHVSHDELSNVSDTAPFGRDDAMSPPPPRASTSTPGIALAPPPRSSSLRHMAVPRPLLATSAPLAEESRNPAPSIEILEPPPTTPPYTISERRNGPTPLALHIPSTSTHPAMHSAPAPSSPTSFFDSIQAQPNAMDDLDSSSDESDSEENNERDSNDALQDSTSHEVSQLYIDPRTRKISNARDSLMRLGNHSTPYVARPSLPFGVTDPKQPIGYTPPQTRPQFFVDKAERSVTGSGTTPVSSFDFFKYAQDHPRRPATADENVQAWQHKQRDQESLRRLDGLLVQHMEAEKDRLKRIASNIQSSNNHAP
ncbi:hypothetical protein BDZ89DRAFT_1058396 [Hymenopellis radicata]|nr:hypothetical protein BDZ89DRAFT_1058396 [Hymenopellis radicata]